MASSAPTQNISTNPIHAFPSQATSTQLYSRKFELQTVTDFISNHIQVQFHDWPNDQTPTNWTRYRDRSGKIFVLKLFGEWRGASDVSRASKSTRCVQTIGALRVQIHFRSGRWIFFKEFEDFSAFQKRKISTKFFWCPFNNQLDLYKKEFSDICDWRRLRKRFEKIFGFKTENLLSICGVKRTQRLCANLN